MVSGVEPDIVCGWTTVWVGIDSEAMTIIYIILAAAFSSMAGTGIPGSAGWALLSGVAAAFAVLGPVPSLAFVLLAVGWSVGRKIGLGNSVGQALIGSTPDPWAGEWWQVGPLLKYTWLSVLALGTLRGLMLVPAVLLADAYYWLPLAMCIGTVAAVGIGRLLVVYAGRKADDGWALQEWYPLIALAPVLL